MFKVLLSPAKSIDVNALRIKNPTTPQFESFASKLALELKKKSPKQLGELMSISEKLADVNWTRFQNWKKQQVLTLLLRTSAGTYPRPRVVRGTFSNSTLSSAN